jgi:acetyl-CoA carboxylase biotin carboxyl carrier protein
MDLQLIKALIDMFAASDMAEMEYTAEGATLRLVKHGAQSAPSPVRPTMPAPATPSAAPAPAAIVTAPLYGVVHLQRTPDSSPFVAAGQAITAGQVLCVIEAMKVFTEIRAERDGTIAEVLVQTGQEVDAGQALFRLD